MTRSLLAILFSLVVGCTAAPAPLSLTSTSSTPTTAESAPETAAFGVAKREPSPTPIPTVSPPPAPTLTGAPTAPTKPAMPNSAQARSVRLMAVGDVMLGWEVGRKIKRKGPAAPWVGVKTHLDQADLVVANLECVISDRGQPWPTKRIHLRAPLAAADSLVAGGVDVVSVANNHALDFGADAFSDMLRRIDERGIGYVGGGSNAAAAAAPLIVEENGLRIAFLGYVLPFSSRPRFSTRDWEAGLNRAGLVIGTPDRVRRDVAQAGSSADLVVVSVHGGVEYKAQPNSAQRAFAEAAIDAGAALVLGHHPHVLQGYMRRAGTLVAFSLGNFLFARFDGAPNDTAILDVTLTPAGVTSVDWIPLVIEGGIPRAASPAEAARILRRIPEI